MEVMRDIGDMTIVRRKAVAHCRDASSVQCWEDLGLDEETQDEETRGEESTVDAWIMEMWVREPRADAPHAHPFSVSAADYYKLWGL